ncbi:uncharacterized protein M421DRAFT_115499 [Didymella exigua CBS 183.55]|uniref:Uncharacterized protein n=1 Tax=Didymella exigua CBS 183.55 TaxID=1150837 RepID=A0A6A5S372_9PLEO|nr:uncharacterized protein M421DRAFT_115499 [Didymella exigua CBS 183.55]KAF1934199.1 hypothetical protein M421DRAFT_115499 [Didymella exigua CBS 183.55]
MRVARVPKFRLRLPQRRACPFCAGFNLLPRESFSLLISYAGGTQLRRGNKENLDGKPARSDVVRPCSEPSRSRLRKAEHLKPFPNTASNDRYTVVNCTKQPLLLIPSPLFCRT